MAQTDQAHDRTGRPSAHAIILELAWELCTARAAVAAAPHQSAPRLLLARNATARLIATALPRRCLSGNLARLRLVARLPLGDCAVVLDCSRSELEAAWRATRELLRGMKANSLPPPTHADHEDRDAR